MRCDDARTLLWFGHKPAELSADDAAALENHLQACPVCRARAQRERAMDAAIARTMHAVTPPTGAQQRLLGHLRQRTRTRRRWFSTAAALAAAILIGIGLASYFYFTMPVPLNLDGISTEINAQPSSKEPRAVARWFAANGAAIEVPTLLSRTRNDRFELDYFQLHRVGFAQLQGMDVPYLLFHNTDRAELLHVYVLSNQHFDLASPPEGSLKRYAGNLSMELLSGPSPDYRYLVAYTSGNLQPFCKPRPNAQ